MRSSGIDNSEIMFQSDDEPDFITENEELIGQITKLEDTLDRQRIDMAGLEFSATIAEREAKKTTDDLATLKSSFDDFQKKVEADATNHAIDDMVRDAKSPSTQTTPDALFQDDDDREICYDDVPYTVDSRSIAHWAGGARKLQIYKFRTAAADTFVNTDELLFKKVSDTTVQRVDFQKLYNAIYHDTGFHRHIDTWAVNNHPHSQHSNFNTDDHKRNAAVALLRIDTGGTRSRNACDTQMAVGDDAGNFTWSPHKRKFYNSSNDTCIIYADTSYVKVTGRGLQVNDTSNFWKKSRYKVKTTGASLIQAENLSIHPTTTGSDVLVIGNVSNSWSSVDMHSTAISLIANGGNFYLRGNGTNNLNLGEGGATGWAGIYYDGEAGRTITGWTTKGGLTGTSVQEIAASELRPTDKILVVR